MSAFPITPRQRAGTPRLVCALAAILVLGVLAVVPSGARAATGLGGAALLARLQSGQTTCSRLSAGDFTLMGRYDMGQIMGSTAADNAMDVQMRAVSGAREEQLAYRFMGERLGGCATGNGPVAFGTMMGLMGTTMMGASYGSDGTGDGAGPATMYADRSAGTGASALAVAGIAAGSILFVAMMVLAALTWRRGGPVRRLD